MSSKLLCLVLVAACLACSSYSKQRQGDEAVAKIDQFYVRENRLPSSLREIGIRETEEGPIYYRIISHSHYEVWYGARLGESVTYDSERKTWR